MCNYVSVTVDFSNFGLDNMDLKVPIHFTISQLISILVNVKKIESSINDRYINSAIARVSSQYISSVQTLADCNVKDGEILYLLA